ncbi:ParB N-terminal domain-containing protein [Streptomyces viridosporus]|uniref:hypothetical protein n=1 Tax=Streptomyces viridosporus TaxID=67581 RepID=UPI00370298A8
MTKARLGEESQDPERLLTKSLRPVREVMSAGDLDFNQLLQRDLDDHRVATSLIPYLLKPRATGPAFFPPIVAVLLPFKNKRPSHFPPFGDPTDVPDDGLDWRQWQAGDSFQVRRVIDENGNIHGVNLGQLRWNSAAAQIVVLDGQHRAMALLAIDRTQSQTWQDNEGSKYRSFYEQQVKRYLKEYGTESSFDLSRVEVPVTVCWFPDKTGETGQPHEAARKLFVDVNKEARPPSESRIILLSDAELVNVLTRSLLSVLRSEQGGQDLLPLYAVEYDNPDVDSSRPARWSVMTNINLLKMAVSKCIFGPPKYLQNVAQKIGSRESKIERDTFMRQQLDIKSLFLAEIEDGGFPYRRDFIRDDYFPLGQVDRISRRFSETWGMAMLSLLSKTSPYTAHTRALAKMESDWSAIEPFASLARDALFGGVGVYWTLKDSYEHYREEVRAKKPQTTRNKSDDVIRAWEVIEKKKGDFELLRAEEYLGTTKQDKVAASKAAFEAFNTHACQLGLMMTLGSLWELRKEQRSDWSINDLPAFGEAMVKSLNAFLEMDEGRGRAHDRRLAFSKSARNSINQITKMDTPRAIYFRYFWLQAIATPAAWEHMAGWFDGRAGFDGMLSVARRAYLKYCTDEQYKALKVNAGNGKDEKVKTQAAEQAAKALRQALSEWFFVDKEDFDAWLAAPDTTPPQEETADSDTEDEDVEDPEDFVDAAEVRSGSLEELLAGDDE